MNPAQLKYQIGLSLIPGIGDVRAKKLIAYCGGVEAIFKEKKNVLLKIPDIGKYLANNIISYRQKALERAEEEIEFIIKNKISPLFFLDEKYPKRLKNCNDSPVMLYYKGNADLNVPKVISIVGSRKATDYGKKVCEELIRDLEVHNILVVSGLAYGIDICAHRSALKYNLKTIAVLGSGLDIIYPFSHKSTAEKMLNQGGLLTDYISKTPPDKENFPKRNRIIAGLSDAVIVIESALKGGALITADIANSYNRDVFAVPGKINDFYSQGCNFLIKTNRAVLVESAKDIEYIMNWTTTTEKTPKQKKLFIELKEEEKILVDLIREYQSLTIDDICIKSNLSMSKVSSSLLNLEFEGIVKCLPGKVYKLN